MNEPTWDDLVISYPRLRELEIMAKREGRMTNSYGRWYAIVKPALTETMGYSHGPGYNVAYEHLLKIYEGAGWN